MYVDVAVCFDLSYGNLTTANDSGGNFVVIKREDAMEGVVDSEGFVRRLWSQNRQSGCVSRICK